MAKRKRRRGVSPPAGGDEGFAPSTAPPFIKGGRKFYLGDGAGENFHAEKLGMRL